MWIRISIEGSPKKIIIENERSREIRKEKRDRVSEKETKIMAWRFSVVIIGGILLDPSHSQRGRKETNRGSMEEKRFLFMTDFFSSISISLSLCFFLCLSLSFSAFLYLSRTSLSFCVFLCLSVSFYVFLCLSVCFCVFLCLSLSLCHSLLEGGVCIINI